MARTAIGPKTRFEVFKRDSFTCQYCGKTAPEVVLNVDHMVPVAKGGDNNLLNLVTSCFSCNSGKGKRELSDTAVVTRQMDQLKLLNERQQQVEMIARWRASMVKLENTKLEALRSAINLHLSRAKHSVSESFLRTELKSCLSKYDLNDTLEAVEKSAAQYLRDPESPDDRSKFLNMIPRICYWIREERINPEVSQLRKLAYVANKKWYSCNPQALTRRLIHLNENDGVLAEDLQKIIFASSGIMSFEKNMQTYFDNEDAHG